MSHPLDRFHELESADGPAGVPDARYVGELYFQAHRGTYTSQARTKRGNRKTEFALREAEMWSVAAHALTDYFVDGDGLDRAWKKVLLNQFHDIIPGSSIHRVYDEAEAAYAEVLETTGQIVDEATSRLTREANALTVFNSLSWERPVLVSLAGALGASDSDGRPLPCQVSEDGACLAQVTVPACGWATVRPMASAAGTTESELLVGATFLENALLRAAYWAADRGSELTQPILEESCMDEYVAAGKVARDPSLRAPSPRRGWQEAEDAAVAEALAEAEASGKAPPVVQRP